MMYAQISAGQIVGYLTPSAPLPAHKLHVGLLPVVEIDPVYDPATQAIIGTEDVIAGDVVERHSVIGPKPAAPIPQEVTETQFIRATVRMGIITADEGKAYLGRGELPAMMQVAIDKLPEPARTDAMLKAIGSASFSRNDGVFKAIVAAGVATDEHIDAVFKLAGSLE
jgi:hypothetical protein